jgi:hypothetical protein
MTAAPDQPEPRPRDIDGLLHEAEHLTRDAAERQLTDAARQRAIDSGHLAKLIADSSCGCAIVAPGVAPLGWSDWEQATVRHTATCPRRVTT